MPRPLWSGSISFGLVNVPVVMFSAARDLGVRFNQLHAKDGARIETRRYCAEEDKEVPFEEIGRAFDLDHALRHAASAFEVPQRFDVSGHQEINGVFRRGRIDRVQDCHVDEAPCS